MNSMKIKYDTDKDVRYKQLPFGTVKSIRDLKLNRRKRGCRGGQDNKAYHHIEKPKGIAWQNLMKIPCTVNRRVRHNGKLCLMVINTQLIKEKEDLLADYLQSKAIDIVIATETWLTNQDRDVIRIESNELVKDGYHISAVNRDRRKEGD